MSVSSRFQVLSTVEQPGWDAVLRRVAYRVLNPPNLRLGEGSDPSFRVHPSGFDYSVGEIGSHAPYLADPIDGLLATVKVSPDESNDVPKLSGHLAHGRVRDGFLAA